ncbi:MAG: hypothetical protein LBM64_05295, partial [Deltaproteobacteria bacterium]|nr:hypothetical protein [Deltaproteobacteria bacterium]
MGKHIGYEIAGIRKTDLLELLPVLLLYRGHIGIFKKQSAWLRQTDFLRHFWCNRAHSVRVFRDALIIGVQNFNGGIVKNDVVVRSFALGTAVAVKVAQAGNASLVQQQGCILVAAHKGSQRIVKIPPGVFFGKQQIPVAAQI